MSKKNKRHNFANTAEELMDQLVGESDNGEVNDSTIATEESETKEPMLAEDFVSGFNPPEVKEPEESEPEESEPEESEPEESEPEESEPEESEPEESQNDSKVFKAKAQSVFTIVYTEPHTHARMVKRLQSGNQVTVKHDYGDWAEITEPVKGFVRSSKLVKL